MKKKFYNLGAGSATDLWRPADKQWRWTNIKGKYVISDTLTIAPIKRPEVDLSLSASLQATFCHHISMAFPFWIEVNGKGEQSFL